MSRYGFVDLGEEVLRVLQIQDLWKMGLEGISVQVAIVDTGLNSSEIEGASPVLEVDFTGEDDTRDRKPHHGTRVANCVRLIAPKCELINAKVIPRTGSGSKAVAAKAVNYLGTNGADVINISLDFNADGCNPTFRPVIESLDGALHTRDELDRSTACVLCLACWDVAVSGVPVIVAAGNRWGKVIQCPARAPGVLYVTPTWLSPAERDYFWSSRFWLRRWWEWRISGSVGRNFGTSFSSAYTSGEIALLMPYIRSIGWLEARERISAPGSKSTTTAMEMYQRLIADHPATLRRHSVGNASLIQITLEKHGARNSISEARVVEALDLAFEHSYMSAHAKAIEELGEVDPISVSRAHRSRVCDYLSSLHDAVKAMDSDTRSFLLEVGLPNQERRWCLALNDNRS